jgi:hypothetical protein
MSEVISPAIRQKVLQSSNSVIELRPLGVVLAVDGSAAVLREPHAAPVQNQYIVIDLKTGKPEISGREVLAEGAMTAINCTAAVVAGIVTLGGGCCTFYRRKQCGCVSGWWSSNSSDRRKLRKFIHENSQFSDFSRGKSTLRPNAGIQNHVTSFRRCVAFGCGCICYRRSASSQGFE